MAALRAHGQEKSQESFSALGDAVRAAADDGREQGLRAEELLVAFKAAEARAGVVMTESRGTEPERTRTRLIRAMLEAYYRPGKGST